MTTPGREPKITDEMRRLVHEEDCKEHGHEYDISNVIKAQYDKTIVTQQMDSGDELKLPHLLCRRCGNTWIVIPVSGVDYEDAERVLYGWMRADHPVAKDIVRKRGKREEARKPKPNNTK